MAGSIPSSAKVDGEKNKGIVIPKADSVLEDLGKRPDHRKNLADNGHAIISPSSATMWMNCEGQPALAKGYPSRSNKNAEWGTECHDYAKVILRAYFNDAKAMSFDHILDREQRAVVKGYCDFCVEKIWKNFIKGAQSYSAHIEVDLVSLEDIVYGTGDFIGVRQLKDRTDVLVVDLKTGFHDVKVPENKQFINYAIGAKKKFNANGKLILIGYLPRVEDRVLPYEKWEIPAADVDKWEAEIAYKGRRALQMYRGEIPVETNPGEAQCEWCPVQCPDRFQEVAADAGLEVLGEELMTDLVDKPALEGEVVKTDNTPVKYGPLSALELPDIESYSPEQLGKILHRIPDIEAWFESLEHRAVRLMTAGVKVPGRKLVATQTRRGWTKGEEKTIAAELMKRGIEDPWQKKLVGIGVVEAEIGKGKINDLTTMSTPTITSAPDSDKRVEFDPASTNALLTDIT